jgi:hypothetical protein
MTVLDWMLDSDPSIRWQALRDLVGAPAEVVAAERVRGHRGVGCPSAGPAGRRRLWEGGALFPARKGDSDAGDRSADGDQSEDIGQPWTATAYSLVLLRDLGVDPRWDQVRRAVALVRDNCLLRSKQQPDGTWLLETTHPGKVYFMLEDGDGRPSRWNTPRALRVLNWYGQSAG